MCIYRARMEETRTHWLVWLQGHTVRQRRKNKSLYNFSRLTSSSSFIGPFICHTFILCFIFYHYYQSTIIVNLWNCTDYCCFAAYHSYKFSSQHLYVALNELKEKQKIFYRFITKHIASCDRNMDCNSQFL